MIVERGSPRRTYGISLLIFIVVFAFWSDHTAADENTSSVEFMNLYQSATGAPHLVDRLNGGPIKWNKSNLKIGFLVPNRSFLDDLRALNEAFETNASAISDATGINFTVGAWWDKSPEPDILVYIGDPDSILRVSRTIESRFGVPGYRAALGDRHSKGVGLCLPLDVFEDEKLRHIVLLIDTENDPEFCFVRSLAYSMGLTGSLPPGVPSILSTDFSTRQIGELDRKILSKIYRDN